MVGWILILVRAIRRGDRSVRSQTTWRPAKDPGTRPLLYDEGRLRVQEADLDDAVSPPS